MPARLWMDIHGLSHLGRTIAADCIVNLTNSGPLRSSIPSILYQRNPIYFDPAWVARMHPRQRLDAYLRRTLAYQELRSSSAVVTPSAAMQHFLQSWLPSSPRWRPVVIPHAVDTTAFPFVVHTSHDTGPVRLLSVGHPAPHKGLLVSIRTVHELRSRGIDASLTLTIAANGYRDGVTGYTPAIEHYVETLIMEVRRLQLDDIVHFEGPTADVSTLYATHDALLFPSHTESFGFPLLEAMSSGLPVVASDIPATREVLADHGWLFRDSVPHAAADAVAAVLTDVTSARLIAARQYAETHTWSRNAQQLADLVDEVISLRSSLRRRPRWPEGKHTP